MIYQAAADAILILHLCFLLFVSLGGFAVLRWPRLAWVHVPATVWGILIEYAGWICPLTPLEVALRQRGGQPGYAGGFIDHYLTAIIYPAGLTRGIQWMLGSVVLVVNVVIYARLFARRREHEKRGHT
jgi:hypothetical protein